jgi:hypothetical protein
MQPLACHDAKISLAVAGILIVGAWGVSAMTVVITQQTVNS